VKPSPKPAVEIESWQQCDEALSSLIVADALRRRLEAERDADIQRIRDTYEKDDPAQPGKLSIERLAAQTKALRTAIEQWAFGHRNDFGDSRTRDLSDGTIQLRLGNPSVRLLSRKWTWETVLEGIKAAAARGRKLVAGWIRVKEEIEKPAILLAYRDGKATPEDLAGLGLRIDQAENVIIRDREGKEIGQ